MRPVIVLSMILPLVLAHTSGMDRRTRHPDAKRQLLGGGEEDPDTALPEPVEPDLTPQSTSSFAVVAPPRSTTPPVVATSTPVGTTARPTSSRSSVLPTSVIGTSSAVSPTGAAVSGSGSLSGSASASSVSGSLSGSMSASANATSSASSSAAAASSSASSSMSMSQILHTSVDEGGRVVIVTQYYTPSASPVSSAAAAASSSSPPTTDAPALSIPAIIGISVAVGVVILGLIGCAVWRMKRRGSDEDEAIRWPELNRHGDSDTHHALPARATGKHGIETDALERSLSNSSDVYMSQTHHARPPSMPMALNGSNFGATSALDYDYAEKDLTPNPSPPVTHAVGYDYGYPAYPVHPAGVHGVADGYEHEDYANLPPPMGTQSNTTPAGLYESDSEGDHLGAGGAKVGAGAPPVYRG